MNWKILVAMFLIMFVLSNVYAIGVGISTQTIYFKGILRGGYAESVVTASNPNGYDVFLGVSVSGDIAPWITFDPVSPNIIIPANSNGDFKIMIQPPPFVQNGVYTGQIIVLSGTEPGAVAGGTGSAVVAGAAIDVSVEISDNEIKNMSMSKIVVDPTEECWPITFRASMQNGGNVENTPTCSVKLYTTDRSFLVKETSKTFSSILPTVTRTDFIQLDYHWEQLKCIEKGNYIADVSCTTSDNTNFYTASIPVQIAPKDTLISENPTAVATSTVSGGQSMATLVHSANAISAEEINAISENVTVTSTEIVSGATKVVSASNTSASGKMIQISVNGKEITVTPSVSTVVIKDGEVIVNTTEIHLNNGKMFMGNTEVNVTPQQAKDKIETKLQAKIEKFELKDINGKALYAMEIKEQRRLFGLFPLRATITEEVDATTGKLVKDVRPWWYAFSTEQPTTG